MQTTIEAPNGKLYLAGLDLGTAKDFSVTVRPKMEEFDFDAEFKKINAALAKVREPFVIATKNIEVFFDEFKKIIEANPLLMKKIKGRERHLRAYRRRGQK